MLTTILNLIALQETTGADGSGSALPGSWIFLVAIVVLFGWMFWKQSRDQKKRKEQIAALGKGSKVITSGGIIGKIADADATTFVVEIAPSVKITVDKSCVFPVAEQPQK